jgi:steroid delta-isomerase
MPSPDEINAAVTRYLAAVAGGTANNIADCYAPDATVEDPVGSEPYRGRDAIIRFYAQMEGMRRETKLLTIRVAADSAAFHFLVRATLHGQTVEVEPIDLMTFDEAGLVTSMRAFWSEADLRVT